MKTFYLYFYLQRKCEQYWGESMGEVYESPDKEFQVTTTSVMQFADYVIRTFVLRRVSDFNSCYCTWN